MAFAQFYYDPALEFERSLEDDGESSPMTAALVDGPRRTTGSGGATTTSTSIGTGARSSTTGAGGGGDPPSPQSATSRWFGDGCLKRRATTGSINGGSHPGIPK